MIPISWFCQIRELLLLHLDAKRLINGIPISLICQIREVGIVIVTGRIVMLI